MASDDGVLPLGYRFDFDPIPPMMDQTIIVDVPPVVIAIEARTLSDELIGEMYADNSAALESIQDVRGDDAPADTGVSLHIMDERAEREYLRFDIFEGDPHYHYLNAGQLNISIPFDVNGHGDMFEWTLACLEKRLQQMLRFAGADALADRVDEAAVRAALPRVVEVYDEQLAKVESARR